MINGFINEVLSFPSKYIVIPQFLPNHGWTKALTTFWAERRNVLSEKTRECAGESPLHYETVSQVAWAFRYKAEERPVQPSRFHFYHQNKKKMENDGFFSLSHPSACYLT